MSNGKKSIQVAIKVRPLLEKEKNQQTIWRVENNTIQLVDSPADPFYFDHVFDQDASNQTIFNNVAKPIIHAAIEGFNGTIFAYGQTSSGKTYTMMGDEENPGVMVLAAQEIFRQIEVTTERQFLLRIGYIEIYNEKIFDLMNKKNQDLKIHEPVNGLVSVNCEESIITCENEFLYHLTQGSKERKVGETNMNERSSRSHAIFRIIIESRKIDRTEDDSVTQSILNLVDLAGSERADQTGARGTRLKEGGHINKSLLFLSTVIKRLSEDEDQKYISYRDSKLTRILQASLGGNALTAIICTIKPTAFEETQSTLNFALRAKFIKNKPQVNETVTDATMMKRLEREIKTLKLRLEEEQRKNESQIKVKHLEQRIRDEDLKIISGNSLHSVRNREARRRTWCPSTNLNISTNPLPSALPVPAMPPQSRLQPPKNFKNLTPLISLRTTEPPEAPQTLTGLPVPEGIPEIDEEFTPSEMVNFEQLSPLKTPKLNPQSTCRVSITPLVTQNPKKLLEVVEHDFMELQEFTNLENRTDVQHDPQGALNQRVEQLKKRNEFLEKERLEYLEVKTDVEHLQEYKKRCDELQIQVAELTNSNKIANEKIEKYDHDLAELKSTNVKLEMEIRESVNLEFEFERHKNKSKLRESELLELLHDKDQELSKLEKSLKSITAEQLKNSKEELLQLTRIESNEEENGKVCVKCADLERLLEENRKVTREFEKLTIEFQQLKLNIQEIELENNNSKAKLFELEELRKSDGIESEKLHKDLQVLKGKLLDIQKEYEEVNLDNISKNQECDSLILQLELARQDMVALQEKYNTLEISWQSQQLTLKDIESQYAEIEVKYEHLQTEYKQLESSKGETLTDCERLQKENAELQCQIDDLKLKVQDVQQQLLDNAEKTVKSCQNDVSEASDKDSNLRQQNEGLTQKLAELQTKFDELQQEYDDLSNQLMDNLQESETLKDQNIKLNEKLQEIEEKCAKDAKAEFENIDLKSQLEKLMASERKTMLKTPSPCRNSSMRSSGVCIEEEEEFENNFNDSDDMLQKFCKLSECLSQIELEHQEGKRRLFKTPTSAKTPNYKLCLRNISGVVKSQKDFTDELENIHLQGSFKQHSFHIVEVSPHAENGADINVEIVDQAEKCDKCLGYINKLEEQISMLKALNEEERHNGKVLLENTERTLREMKDQITQLSAELLEKSMFVESCACKSYQSQIESLEKEKADITLMCEELQEKVSNYTLGESLMNVSFNGDLKVTAAKGGDLSEELQSLRSKHNELQETLESQTKMLEYLTQQNLDLDSDLKATQEAMEVQEKNHKEKCNLMQLELLEKLEISANKHRDNMKKYNSEWEERKELYESTIQDLEQKLETLREVRIEQSKVDEDHAKKTQEHLKNVQKEYNQLQAEHLELKQQLETESANELLSNELRKEYEIVQQELKHMQLTHSKMLEDHSQNLKELKASETSLLQEKSQLDSDLRQLREDFKEINDKYNALVLEKEMLIEEKENLLKQICDIEKQLQRENAMQQHYDNILSEKEQLNMELKQMEQKLQSAEAQIEEFCAEDASREEMIKSLQNKVTSIEALEEEKEKMNDVIEKIQKELSETRIELEQLHSEKQQLEMKLSDSSDSNKEHNTIISKESTKDEKHVLEAEDRHRKELLEQKTFFEEQLKNFKNKMEENKILKAKIMDYEALQDAHKTLKDQNEREKQSLQENLKQYESLLQEKLLLQEELTSLEGIREKNLLMEDRLKNMDDLHQKTNKDLEIQVQQERQALEAKIREHDILCKQNALLKEQLEAVNKTLKEGQLIMDEKRKEFKALEEQNKALEERITSLQLKCDDYVKALDTLMQEKCSLEDALNDEKKSTTDTQKQVERLQKQKNDIEKQLLQSSELHDKTKRDKTDLEDQLKVVSTSLETLRQEKSDLEEQLLAKIAENEKKNAEMDNLCVKISNLQTNMRQSLQTLDDLKAKEITSLKQNESLKETITTLTNSSESLELERCNVVKQLHKIEEELQLVNNNNEILKQQLSQLTEVNKSLNEQHTQLIEDKKCLEVQLNCLKQKSEVEKLLEQMIIEKAETYHNLCLANESLKCKEEELTKLTQDCEKAKCDIEMLKCRLLFCSQEKQQLEKQLEQYEHLREEKANIEATLESLKLAQGDAFKAFEVEKNEAKRRIAKYEQEISIHKDKEETLGHKVEALSQQLHEMGIKTGTYERLVIDHEELEKTLSKTTQQNTELSKEITKLKSSISTTSQSQKEIINTHNARVQKLETELQQTLQQEKELRSHVQNLEQKLQQEQTLLKKQSSELSSSLAELQSKYDSLQFTNSELQKQNQALEQQAQKSDAWLKEGEILKLEIISLQDKYEHIQQEMKATVDEASRCSQGLREELQHNKDLLAQQLETYNSLRLEMASKEISFDAEKAKLSATIGELQSNINNLQEKIREITVNNFKQDLQRQTGGISVNTSLNSTASLSPRGRKSLDSVNISVEDKLCTSIAKGKQHSAERKNRRLSSFNERRTSFWGATHDKETMTVPVDTNCNCQELDSKLQECKRNLFIRESQVTVLNMELKNHPLKDENAALIKRIQEEQDRYRMEIKRYKQKLYEQNIKFEKSLAAATADNARKNSQAAETSTENLKIPIIVANAETQTDCDLSASFSKLQGKYQDLISVCRFRKRTIEELQNKLSEKENINGNAMSTDESGHITILKSQCENLKTELKVIKEKYENAKIVLHSRREEIQRLRSQLGVSQLENKNDAFTTA